ncbi:hypothetical protein G9C85_13395 [Halorubellus sp. JP-L1]|uniref:hypothetical protein n=1 Tax=Halorubellus sp. JP-L1 TaxID=2715753 RepID=UPI00140A1339|nr:hypothetical protein [Halorubellus sp. JP-L1]NHN42616.1 hypothetical protein [Halorubellus sp. JP-L1]
MGLFDAVRRALGRGDEDGKTGGDAPSRSDGAARSDNDASWGLDADAAAVDPQPGPRRRGGGHGRHWDTAVDGDEALRAVVARTLDEGTVQGSRVPGVDAVEYGAGTLRCRVLRRDGDVVTAFPVADGVAHETTVTEVTQWANDLEADASVVLGPEEFATYGASAWRVGGVPLGDASVEIAALAYAVERADEAAYETADGGEFSTREMAGFAPVDGGGVADYAFQTTVREVQRVPFFDANGYRFRVPLTRDGEETDYDTWLYAGAHAIDGRVPEAGEDVSGAFWVQADVR